MRRLANRAVGGVVSYSRNVARSDGRRQFDTVTFGYFDAALVWLEPGGSHWDHFHLVWFDIRQLRQLPPIFPGKVQSDVTGITDVNDHETGIRRNQALVLLWWLVSTMWIIK